MSAFPAVVGFSQLVAPALSTLIFSNELTSWVSIPSFLAEGSDDFNASLWFKKYFMIVGHGVISLLLLTISFGFYAVAHLPANSATRFYYLSGTIASVALFGFFPYFRYKTKRISYFSRGDALQDQSLRSHAPKEDIRQLLRVQVFSTIVNLAAVVSYWIGLYNLINRK